MMSLFSSLKNAEKLIKNSHRSLDVNYLVEKNRDYKKFLQEVMDIPLSDIVSFGRKLPLYRLNFLALAILDDNEELRIRIERILIDRKHASFLKLLFPFIQNNINNIELMNVIRFCLKNNFEFPIIEKKRKIFKEIIDSVNPAKKCYEYLIKSGEELEEFIEWSNFKLSSSFVEEVILYLIKKVEPERVKSDELLLYLPILEEIPLNYLVDFIKKYSAIVGKHDFNGELSYLLVKRMGEPTSSNNKLWKSVHYYVRDVIREIHVKKIIEKLSNLHTKFEFYTLFKNEIEAIEYKENLGIVFILFKNVVVVESIHKNVNGSIFSREVFNSFLNSKKDKELSPQTKLALEILPLHDIDYDDGEYILKRYVKKSQFFSKLRKGISYINWKMGF